MKYYSWALPVEFCASNEFADRFEEAKNILIRATNGKGQFASVSSRLITFPTTIMVDGKACTVESYIEFTMGWMEASEI